MLILENIGLALTAIRANLSRSILTMLGIIIGVAAVIGIFTISDALDSELADSFGDDATVINIGVSEKRDENDRRPRFGGIEREKKDEDYITKEIIDDVMNKYSDKLECVMLSETVGSEGTAIDSGEESTVSILGVNEDTYRRKELELVAGHDIKGIDYEQGHRVCVVSETVVDDLYDGDADVAVGSKLSVKVDGVFHSYNIVGVYKEDEEESYGGWEGEDSTVLYIPLLLAMNENHHLYKFENISLVANDFNECEELTDVISNYINRRYYKNNNYFEVDGFCLSSLLSEINDMLTKISFGLACIAGISLLVGGIGVMNIMLVSITERTREIGTRKALGADNTSIRIQFIVESIVLCMVGGLLGIILGAGLGALGCKLMESEFVLTARSILIAVGFSAIVGIFFGYYPANKAAKMNPIDALRYE